MKIPPYFCNRKWPYENYWFTYENLTSITLYKTVLYWDIFDLVSYRTSCRLVSYSLLIKKAIKNKRAITTKILFVKTLFTSKEKIKNWRFPDLYHINRLFYEASIFIPDIKDKLSLLKCCTWTNLIYYDFRNKIEPNRTYLIQTYIVDFIAVFSINVMYNWANTQQCRWEKNIEHATYFP